MCAWLFLTASGMHEINLLLQVLVWNGGTEPQCASLIMETSRITMAKERKEETAGKGSLGKDRRGL